MWYMFLEIWEERKVDGKNYSELSGEYLGLEPKSYMFDHLLEKSAYPEYKFNKDNIVLLTLEEHGRKGSPLEHSRHTELIRNYEAKTSD